MIQYIDVSAPQGERKGFSFFMKKLRYLVCTGFFLFAAMLFTMAAGAEEVPAGYLLPESSYAYITADQISGWPSQALSYARNEIYARNGEIFSSGELQAYFGSQYWYHGLYSPDQFTDAVLNVYETANVQLLLSTEQSQGEYILDQAGYSFDAVAPYVAGGEGDYSDAAVPADSSSYEAAQSASQNPYYVDPGSCIFSDSSERLLTSDEISMLTLQELCYARNEIYARHGLIFSSTELSDYFNAKNWYWGTVDASAWSDSLLNSVEIGNINALKAAEDAQGGYQTDQPGYSYEMVGTFSSGEGKAVSESDFIFPDSQFRYLTDDDTAGLSLQQLCYARNEIYARRGYIFQSEELRQYFASKTWYSPAVPADSFSESVFNEYELANIGLLKSHEYAINPNGYQLY